MPEEMSIENLLEQYMRICLGAIIYYKNLAVSSAFNADPSTNMVELNFAAYIRDGEHALRYYVDVQHGGFSITTIPEKMPRKIWRTDRRDLEHFVNAPVEYIKNPAAFNLSVLSL